MLRILSFALLLLVSVSSCMKQACPGGVKATMLDLAGLDGCGFVLELEDGTRLEPLNLGEFDFTPKDGLKLRVSYKEEPSGSICMVGPSVRIECISQR
jgi:hypothetical protein